MGKAMMVATACVLALATGCTQPSPATPGAAPPNRGGVNSDMTQTTPKVYMTNFGLGGASAQGTVGVGAGANVLVGGSSNQITLQPVSIEGSVGLNVAAGVAALSLTKAP